MEKYTLKQWRSLRGFTRKELAKKVGLSEKTIEMYEKNCDNIRKASINNLYNICDALGIRLEQIFFENHF